MAERESGFEILIAGELPPAPNGPRGLLRSHWGVRRKMIKAWETRVWAAWHVAGRPRIRGPVAIEAVRWYASPRRALDPDNLVASLKLPLDGLVRCGAIEDDSARVVASLSTYQDRVDLKTQEGLSFSVVPFGVPPA
jgi:hypothetical protein